MSDTGWLISGADAKLVLAQGGTLDRAVFQWGTQASETADFVPVDCSTYTARMQIRPTASSSTVLLDLTTENGGLDLDDEGYVTLTITDEQAAALPSGTHQYEIEIYSSGTVIKFARGEFSVPREVVRPTS